MEENKKDFFELSGRRICVFGNIGSSLRVIHITGEHETKSIEAVADLLHEKTEDFLLIAFPVKDWNNELSPWKAPAVFNNEDFGDRAGTTLDIILNELIPTFESRYPSGNPRYFLSGYSLAGLFALWLAFRTDKLSGVAAVSPSVWFKGFIEFTKNARPLCSKIYLSLGDREDKVKNKPLSTVREAIIEEYGILEEQGVRTVLEWNKGNHFVDFEKRTAKGILWLLSE